MDALPELLAGARSGSRQAMAELFARYYERVAAIVHREIQRRLRPQQHGVLRLLSTGDIVQEVFLEVLRGFHRWEGDREDAFVTLLATLVEHRLVDQVRRSQAARRDVRRIDADTPTAAGVVAGEASPGTIAASGEQLVIYREVLQTFPERERALLTLRLEDGLEFGELAARLAWPTADAARKAFYSAQGRLLMRLRQRGITAPESAP